jgi:uncharacterized protein
MLISSFSPSNSISSQVKWFLIPVFGITYLLAAVAWLLEGVVSFPLGFASMFVPALVAIVIHSRVGRFPVLKDNLLGIRPGAFKFYLYGIFFFFGLVSLCYGLTFLLFPETVLDYGSIHRNISRALSGFVSEGLGFEASVLLLFAMNILVAPLVNIYMFLGEEIGWRAFLAPRLLLKYRMNGVFITGLIWALWHVPGIFLGLNYPENPWVGSLVFIAWCIPVSIILQYFYVKSESIFCVAICHGVINWTASTYMMFFVNMENWDYVLFGGPGMVGVILFWGASWFFYKKLRIELKNT